VRHRGAPRCRDALDDASSSASTPSPVLAEMCKMPAGRPSTASISARSVRVGWRAGRSCSARHDLAVVLQRLVSSWPGSGPGCPATRRQEDRPLAGSQEATHLVAGSRVPGRVDQVQHVAAWWTRTFCALMVMPRSRSMSHRVEVLLRYEPGVDRPGELQDPVRQRRLAWSRG